jgi:hypothetical protein
MLFYFVILFLLSNFNFFFAFHLLYLLFYALTLLLSLSLFKVFLPEHTGPGLPPALYKHKRIPDRFSRTLPKPPDLPSIHCQDSLALFFQRQKTLPLALSGSPALFRIPFAAFA